jgi:hypothetical protein
VRTVWSNKFLGIIDVMGSSFPHPPGDFIIHSLYPEVINFSDNHHEKIYSLLTKKDSIHPHAAILNDNQNQKLKISDLKLEVGQHLYIEESVIIFDCGLWVSFLGAKRTHPNDEAPPDNITFNSDKISICTTVLNKLQLDAKTELRWESLVQDVPEDKPFISQFRKIVHALDNAFYQKNLQAAIVHGLSLVGFGPGLTPTGDDFLCGYSLAAYAKSSIEESDSNHIPMEFTTEWLTGILHQATNMRRITTDISYMFLQLAQEQKYSQVLLSLAKSFCKTHDLDFNNCIEAIHNLGLYGHSSGYDAATGFLFGLSGKSHNRF